MRRRSLFLLPALGACATPDPLPALVVHFEIEAPGLSPESVESDIALTLDRGLAQLSGVMRWVTTSAEGQCAGEVAFVRPADEAERARVAAALALNPAVAPLKHRLFIAAPRRLLQT